MTEQRHPIPQSLGPFAERIAGVDGCRTGWLCVSEDADGSGLRSAVFPTASALLDQVPAPVMMTIDVPIGLVERGERACDRIARSLLGRRACCVFTAPTREMLLAGSHEEASALRLRSEGKRVPVHAWSIFGRIRDIDRSLRSEHLLRVREVHPELCFMELNAGEPLAHGKKDPVGRELRKALVKAEFGARAFEEIRGQHRQSDVADDDILDALAALFTARRIQRGRARVVPNEPTPDALGLRMEMWL